MKKFKIKLNTSKDVSNFINLTTRCVDKVNVYSGRYIVNGKSIMGVFSLDLTKPVEVEFCGDIPLDVKAGIQKYIIEEEAL